MKIGIIGYDIFGTGGTKRSNLNLINEFLLDGDEISFFNFLSFSKKKVTFLEKEIINPEKASFFKLVDFDDAEKCDTYIITRESLFIFSRIIKNSFPDVLIIGEVHAPLPLIDPELDLSEDCIDVYRVATEKIKQEFSKRVHQEKIVVFPISTRHVSLKISKYKPLGNVKNFLIYSRFDEYQKDIAYAIKLFDYLVHELKRVDCFLYINGTGNGELLYRQLITLYGLSSYVFINKNIPENTIYLSTARYETFGYSIFESFARGDRIVIYAGDDHSLKDIYSGFESFCWIEKNTIEDAKRLINFFKLPLEDLQKKYETDMERSRLLTFQKNYGKEYKKKLLLDNTFCESKKESEESPLNIGTVWENLNINNNKPSESFITDIYLKMKELPIIGKIISNEKIKNNVKNILFPTQKKVTALDSKKITGELRNDFVFVESFHGKSFSGDPKHLALHLKREYAGLNIYVSSVNEMVDKEILDYGFFPVRLGSRRYIHKFRKSKLVILNGNSLDKAGKVSGQIFIQTWHGFPLKKMVADLEDSARQAVESEAFLPRMKKWDFLLSSSSKNSKLFSTAFMLKENENLKIIEKGAPRNSYLLNYRADDLEKKRIVEKYFNCSYNSSLQYILYSPTWRKNKRKTVTSLDLKKFVHHLPENYHLIVKLHPLESNLIMDYQNLDERIHCFPNEMSDIQELFLLSSVLVTDYSSAMFDFAHLNRKIVVLQEDRNEYQKEIGWYFELSKLTGLEGKEYSEEELAKAILMETTDKSYNFKIVDNFLNRDSIETCYDVINSIK